MDVVIVGGGGHGSDTFEVLRARPDVRVIGVIDDAPDLPRFAGRLAHLGSIDPEVLGTARFVLGVGHPRSRRHLAARLPAQAAPGLVDPRATVSGPVTLGPGAVVFWNAALSPLTVVGEHSFVSYGASVGHDSQLGRFVAVMPGARISGDVTIEDGVLIGTGAIVLEGRTVGAGAVVGAGACVLDDVEPGVTVVGTPARPISRTRRSRHS